MAESLKQLLGKEAVPIFGWTQGVPVEEQAMQQLKNIAAHVQGVRLNHTIFAPVESQAIA